MSILEEMSLYLVSLYFLGTLMKLYTKYLAIIKAKKRGQMILPDIILS